MGQPEILRTVRLDVTRVLAGCPVRDDAVFIASELAANAVRHSHSGREGGTFLLRVYNYGVLAYPYAWIEVEDQGSAWDGALVFKPTHGLAAVRALSGLIGSELALAGKRVVFARIDYRKDGTPVRSAWGTTELPEDVRNLRSSDPG